jgi:hypothetical protein
MADGAEEPTSELIGTSREAVDDTHSSPCLIFAGILIKASKEKIQILIEASQGLFDAKRNIDLTTYELIPLPHQA